MSLPRLIGALAATSALFIHAAARAGELDKASDNVHSSSSSGSSSRSSSSSSSGSSSTSSASNDGSDDDTSSSSCSDGTDCTSGSAAVFEIGLAIVLSPFYLPYLALEKDNVHPESGWSWMPHPWASGADGYFEPVGGAGAESADYAVKPEYRRITALQVALEGQAPAGGPGRVQGRLRLLTVYRLDFDVAYGAYFDRGDSGGASTAGTGNAHVAFRIAQSQHALFRAGLGARHWTDGQGAVFGFDMLYGFDVFWGRSGPVTTSAEITGGTLGSGYVVEPRATIGAMIGLGELYAGYDATWVIGAGNLPTAYLGGPVAGVRAYF